MKLYPQDTPERFEFDRIRSELKSYCRSEIAAELAEQLVPVSDPGLLAGRLAQTAELFAILANGLFFPEIDHPPLATEIRWLGVKGARLEGDSFLRLATAAHTVRRVYRHLRAVRNENPALYAIVEGLADSKPLIILIEGVIDENGRVRSSASKKLTGIRKKLAVEKARAGKKFDGIIRKYKKLGWLRDFDESLYNNRRVLAVEAEYKRKIRGIIHGISESGKSAFIEPIEMVEINNRVAELEQEEAVEVNRILIALTADVAGFLPDIVRYHTVLGRLDFTRAKVKLALATGSVFPEVNNNGLVRLINARHPILGRVLETEGKKVVPLTLELDTETRIMVISGPNAGGKSIALKTLGLLQIMMQSGLMIPAEEGTSLPIFDKLFVDIGDDQSIEYELSTYSSRLFKMKYFLRAADSDTLILIDEFGTGSDPDLGGALAEVMLEDLMKARPYGMITTHYNNIKVFAENNPGIVNGSMLFERKTLKPTFRLETGQPGSSFTLEVASKIGLSNGLIDRARHVLDHQKVKFDQVLVQLQMRKNELNRKNRQLARQQKILSEQLEKQAAETEELQHKIAELDDPVNKKLIEQGKKYVRLLQFWLKEKKKKVLLKRIIIAAEKMADNERKLKEKDLVDRIRAKKERVRKQKEQRRKHQKEHKWRAPVPGDTVRIGKAKQTGKLVETDPAKNRGVVHFGMMKTIVDLDDLFVVVATKK